MSEEDITTASKGQLMRVNLLLILLAAANLLIAYALSIFGSEMYPFFIIFFVWATVYGFLITILIKRESHTEIPIIHRGIHLLGIAALAVLIRLLFLGVAHSISLDALWYIDYGKFMHMGAVPYFGFYFPYPPVFAYFIYIITSVYQGVEAFRLFAVALDVAVLVLLWKLIHQELGPKWASSAAIAYAFLPIAVIESGWSGHFEPLANLLLLLALWALARRKFRSSGVLFGFSVATKIYPIVVFPVLFMYIKDWRDRVWFTLGAAISSVLTFAPVLLLAWTNQGGSSNISQSISSTSVFESLFGFLFTLPFPADIITIAVVAAIILGVVHLLRLINRDNPAINEKLYRSITAVIGLTLIVIGLVLAIYPLLPVSRQVFWRVPIDISLVRGFTTICIGMLIISYARTDFRNGLKKYVSRNSLLGLVGATALLLVAMARLFFYGWYLLWSIPILLLLRDQRLSYITVLCLLLVYPNFIHDNFATLGFNETRQWQDEFGTINGWTPYINIRGDNVNTSQVSAYIDSDGTNGRFWFDTRNVENSSYLSDVRFSYVKNVEIGFIDSTEFVARITSSWDPTFGRYADLSLTFQGNDGDGKHIDGSIISKTSVFTNLTYALWRYSFMNLLSPTHNGTITSLNLTIYPVQRVESSVQIDFFYTTNGGPLSPAYFLIVPSLTFIILVAFTSLHIEFERERKLTGTNLEEQ